MKKICILFMLLLIVFITGCGKVSSESIFKDLTNKINKLNSYTLTGNLDVTNENNSYNYDVTVSYMAKDKFRISLVNTSNNHEQVILRNDEGVFVLTPSLNKSFKFQSDWPYNNSQIYILGSIIDDLNNDSKMTKEEKNGKYVYTSSVNYPNNSDLTKQRVTVTSDLFIEKVEVLNDKNEAEMIFNVKNIDYSPTFDENYFEVNSIINSNLEENKDTTNSKENTNDKAEDTENKNESSDKETTTDKNTNTTETATLEQF